MGLLEPSGARPLPAGARRNAREGADFAPRQLLLLSNRYIMQLPADSLPSAGPTSGVPENAAIALGLSNSSHSFGPSWRRSGPARGRGLRSRALGEEIAIGAEEIMHVRTHHLRLTGIRVDADLRAVASRIYSRASLGSAAAMLMNEIRKEKWSCKAERNKPLQEKGSNEGHRNLPQGR